MILQVSNVIGFCLSNFLSRYATLLHHHRAKNTQNIRRNQRSCTCGAFFILKNLLHDIQSNLRYTIQASTTIISFILTFEWYPRSLNKKTVQICCSLKFPKIGKFQKFSDSKFALIKRASIKRNDVMHYSSKQGIIKE